jgi:hypothetical protein
MAAAWWPSGAVWSDDRAWGTGWTAAGLGCALLGCLAGFGPGQRRPWRWVGVLGALVAAVILLLDIWAGGTFGVEAFTIATGGALFVAFANLLLLVPLRGLQTWVRHGTIAAGGATAILVDLVVLTESYRSDNWLSRFAAATAISAACGGVAIMVLLGYNRRAVGVAPAPGSLRAMTLTCPRCGRKLSGAVGQNRCGACGMHIRVAVEEPSCPRCGHNLYGPPEARCPECGAAPAEAGGVASA